MVSISMEIMVKWGYYTIYPGGEKNPLTTALICVHAYICIYNFCLSYESFFSWLWPCLPAAGKTKTKTVRDASKLKQQQPQ